MSAASVGSNKNRKPVRPAGLVALREWPCDGCGGRYLRAVVVDLPRRHGLCAAKQLRIEPASGEQHVVERLIDVG